ncbi:uncharacterized protein LOC123308276 [Coccinella septempunctata]|uniref:uncharacterized protein LOC123308276 n=1 Tax=Coccinella septempunctata TaxID=41139 RepID=UPI001D05D2BE|nr:uncharacterized protein LOC123308276 [Coccinella septempunctata]
MYIFLVFFMIFSPSLEASIVITVPPNVHVPTMKNPFPFYQEDGIRIEEGEVKQLIQKWLQKRAPARNHYLQAQERVDMKKIEPIVKSDLMKKILTVCTHAVADTKDNAVASVFSCVLQGFEKY